MRNLIRKAWRELVGDGLVSVFGPADVGPGRNATPEEWARYREELARPRERTGRPPEGYRFVWYTDGHGMRHRAAVRIDREA